MKLNDNTATIISVLGPSIIEQNRYNTQNWGVLFSSFKAPDGSVQDEAWGVSDAMICRWSEFGELSYDKNAPFYVIEENMFMVNQTGVPVEALRAEMAKLKFDAVIRVPVGNIYNFIMRKFPTKGERSKVRIIMKPNLGEIQPGLILLQAQQDDKGQIVFKHADYPDKTFIINKITRINPGDIEVGRLYQCELVSSIDDQFPVVNVKYKFFRGIEFLAHYSPYGYFPDEEKVENSIYYDEDYKLQIPFFLDQKYEFEPIHLAANLFINALSIFRGFDWIHIHVNNHNRRPLLIVGEKMDPSFPLIEVAIQPLNPLIRGDIQ